MKKLLLCAALGLAFTATTGSLSLAQSRTDKPAAPATEGGIKFETETHDFGTIKEGVQATYEFKFTNKGNDPLVLSNVSASCGCTTPTWPREPIMKNKTGVIKAVYNSQGRPGPFTKQITVVSNAGTKVLTIKGTVEKAPAATDGTPAREKSMMEK
jgi:hypothetical protein